MLLQIELLIANFLEDSVQSARLSVNLSEAHGMLSVFFKERLALKWKCSADEHAHRY